MSEIEVTLHGRVIGLDVNKNLLINRDDGTQIILGGSLTGSQSASIRSLASRLPHLRNAVAATLANTADTRISYGPGDSTVAGAFASGAAWAGNRRLSPPALLAQALRAYGLPVSEDSVFGRGENGVSVPVGSYDERMSATTVNWTVTTPGWMGGTCYRNDTNEASTLSFQCAVSQDTVDVYYLASAGGASFTIGVDGGAALGATVSTNAATAVVKVTRTFPVGVHQININRQAGTGACPIFAIVCSNSALKRVHVFNWGSGGSLIATWIAVAQPYDRGNGIVLAGLAPHASINDLGINDAIAGTVPATAMTSYQSLITLQKGVGTDVIIQIPTPVAISQATASVQDLLYYPLRDLARANGCPIIEANGFMGDYVTALAAGYFTADLVHPNAAGYAAVTGLTTGVPGLISGL